ncbi:MAG: DUF1294 domain-containing protein [Verrucomicrobiaceae bacterium]|nr:DUF1294 domain-containing protein [Verrucomicrobiaceae bacterium]
MRDAILLIVLLANLIGVAMVALDKRRARLDRRRISERALVVPAMLGGWPGVLWAMKRFRHKTQKRSFQWKLALAILMFLPVAWLTWRFLW